MSSSRENHLVIMEEQATQWEKMRDTLSDSDSSDDISLGQKNSLAIVDSSLVALTIENNDLLDEFEGKYPGSMIGDETVKAAIQKCYPVDCKEDATDVVRRDIAQRLNHHESVWLKAIANTRRILNEIYLTRQKLKTEPSVMRESNGEALTPKKILLDMAASIKKLRENIEKVRLNQPPKAKGRALVASPQRYRIAQIKGFFRRNWQRLLLGALIGAALVVATVLTLGAAGVIAGGVAAGFAAVGGGAAAGNIALGAVAAVGAGAAIGSLTVGCCCPRPLSCTYDADADGAIIGKGSAANIGCSLGWAGRGAVIARETPRDETPSAGHPSVSGMQQRASSSAATSSFFGAPQGVAAASASNAADAVIPYSPTTELP